MRLEQLLEASAARAPDRVAISELGGRDITFGGLRDAARAMQAALQAAGVRPGDRVGMFVPKTIPAVATVYGVLGAQAVYVPVDVHGPAARGAFIFQDCQVAALVVHASRWEALLAELPGFEHRGVVMEDLHLLVPRTAPPAAETDALAYILYTSGSTGKPKGVIHTHASALAFVDWCTRELGAGPEDRFTSHAPFHFDLSILDLYLSMKHGARLFLIDADEGKQPGLLAQMVAEHRITVWYSTPTILRMLVEFGKLETFDHRSLRLVLFAGEVFPIKHLQALRALWPHPRYYNLFGPTETNVCHAYALPPPGTEEEVTPIGVVVSDDVARVVDLDDKEVAPGEEGELLVAGGSVMVGYWNLPERNAKCFVEQDGLRFYRTGDMVRVRPDGNYLYVGRRDRMVKRRGYRVELGEIEAALNRHPEISEAAAVAVRGEDGDVQIHAFYSWSGDKPPSMIKLKQFAARELPLYMIPDRFNALDALPMTTSDKIDYQRLQEQATWTST
jgi:amino acid adenylation domain-containing protein